MNHMLSAIKLRRIITSNLNIKSDCPINIIPAPSFPQIGVETSAFDFYDILTPHTVVVNFFIKFLKQQTVLKL